MRLLLLILFGVVASLAVLEIAVRVLDVSPRPLAPLELASYRLSDDPVLRYEYRPGLRADDAHFDALHEGLTTNSHGFRDVELPVEKPPGEIRVLALGDSTTAGNGIPELENTWPKRLERRFAESGLGSVRVLNLGVGGYEPDQESRLLELRGLAFAPDLVVMLVCLNDLDRNADGGIRRMLEQARSPEVRPPANPLELLTRVSRLAFVVLHRARALGFDVPIEEGVAAIAPLPDERNPLAQGLARLARLAREHELPVVVALLPAFDQPFDHYRYAALHARMRATASRMPALPWIDLLPDFRGTGVDARRLGVDGLHPNRAGAALLAEILYRHLAARGLPPAAFAALPAPPPRS
ncbi:MAG TPA: SGNH/GDSL hydrolase family protein [Myxococcota bacterium]|nr:SGNH/GDSL hydrolase family protein [Myxococcota bacterium]